MEEEGEEFEVHTTCICSSEPCY